MPDWWKWQTQGTSKIIILERVLSIAKIYVFEDKRDHRIRYVGIDDNGKRIGGSYPRILMAQKLGRSLMPDEDVHHIDGDPTNNSLDNLIVVKHGLHQREHSIKYVDTTERCMICGKHYLMKGNKWSAFYRDLHRNPPINRILTCSKSCAGKASSGKYPLLYDINIRLEEVSKLWKK